MINIFKLIFSVIVKYFLIDFIFICLVLFFPEITSFFINWLVTIVTREIEVKIFEYYPLDCFAFVLFCLTWAFRKKKLLDDGFISDPLTYKQIVGRFFIFLTFIAMYIDKYVLNAPALQVEVIKDRNTLFFELLFCWVIAMTVVEIINGILLKLFRL
ncbi:hypothetical protein B0F87_103144 [Methylobacter tundripaludum]|uniref:Uncharacterized protein n=1 Tax=Methylobacter tundripaludum TaxID=173365 RepID=A0A2S6HGC7_9GAMM|nr:hypothetical protein B0F87_103144 [Methylobacter tundripaludum]